MFIFILVGWHLVDDWENIKAVENRLYGQLSSFFSSSGPFAQVQKRKDRLLNLQMDELKEFQTKWNSKYKLPQETEYNMDVVFDARLLIIQIKNFLLIHLLQIKNFINHIHIRKLWSFYLETNNARELALVALALLNIVPSEAAVERSFFASKLVRNELRTVLTEENFESEMMIRFNLKYLDESSNVEEPILIFNELKLNDNLSFEKGKNASQLSQKVNEKTIVEKVISIGKQFDKFNMESVNKIPNKKNKEDEDIEVDYDDDDFHENEEFELSIEVEEFQKDEELHDKNDIDS